MFLGKIIDYIIGKALFEIYLTNPKEAAVLNLLKKRGFYDCDQSRYGSLSKCFLWRLAPNQDRLKRS